MEVCKEIRTIENIQDNVREIKMEIGELRKELRTGITKSEIESRLEENENRIAMVEKELTAIKIADADLRSRVDITFQNINEFMKGYTEDKNWLKRTVLGNIIGYGINIIFMIIIIYLGLK